MSRCQARLGGFYRASDWLASPAAAMKLQERTNAFTPPFHAVLSINPTSFFLEPQLHSRLLPVPMLNQLTTSYRRRRPQSKNLLRHPQNGSVMPGSG